MMVIDNKYEFGQEVCLKTDVDQKVRLVTGLLVRPNGSMSYELSCGTESRWHYDFEISTDKDVVMKTTNG
jgi:hypothetical protein